MNAFSFFYAGQDNFINFNKTRFSVLRLKDPVTKEEKKNLATTIQAVATAHNLVNKAEHLDKVLRAVQEKRIQANFLMAEKENCRRACFVGGSIQFHSVFTRWDQEGFKHYSAIYLEDLFVQREASKKFRDEYYAATGEKAGLGTVFMQELARIHIDPENMDKTYLTPCCGMIAEYSQDNTAINKSLGKLNTNFDSYETGAVLDLFASFPALSTGKTSHAQIENLSPDTDLVNGWIYPNVFVVTWKKKGEKESLAASFTQAISTFSGDAIVRVQITRGGFPPKGRELRQALSEILLAGRDEAVHRKWIPASHEKQKGSPLLRLHVLEGQDIIDTLHEMGAKDRFLGPYIMKPVTIDFLKMPSQTFSKPLPNITPLLTIPAGERPSLPIGAPHIALRNAALPLSHLKRAHPKIAP